MRFTTWAAALGLLALSFSGSPARASDRKDGSVVTADPSTDINDVFTWMDPGAGRVYLAMTVYPNAGTAAASTAKFSDKAVYVFHTYAKAAYADPIPQNSVEIRVICSFDVAQNIECWVGDNEYVRGNPSNRNGISSYPNGNLRVYAGLVNDPFFWNQTGFTAAIGRVKTLNPTKDATTGCPQLSTANATLVRGDMATPATDTFAGQNTLAIVVSVKKDLLVAANKPILTVWGSTNKKN